MSFSMGCPGILMEWGLALPERLSQKTEMEGAWTDQLSSAWEGLDTRRQDPWDHLGDWPPYVDGSEDRGWRGLGENYGRKSGTLVKLRDAPPRPLGAGPPQPFLMWLRE